MPTKFSPSARLVLEKRYLEKDASGKAKETPDQMFRRVAHHVARADRHFTKNKTSGSSEQRFYEILSKLWFLPNSPTLMNAGRKLGQLAACFVLPVGDSIESIFDAVKYTAMIHKSGGGTGFSFSHIRPANDSVSSTTGISSGPLSFMNVFDVATDASYPADGLELATTYYWKIDEVNETEAVKSWEGGVWSFTTEAFVVVDDFEGYDNDENLIYDTWLDGWVNGSGSTVGYFEEPFAERTIVHGGRQSMPLFYDNATAGISEADLNLDQPQDWTRAGIGTLTLYFHGAADNGADSLYAKINGVRVVYDGDPAALTEAQWHQWDIELASVGTDLTRVGSLTIGTEGSGSGVIYVDDIRLYR